MVRTRNADKSAKDEASQEQSIEQPTENTSESPVASSEKKTETQPDDTKDDGASKARERMNRFKALQARAVCGPQKWLARINRLGQPNPST
jgi:pre-mRNA-splicing factor SYF2